MRGMSARVESGLRVVQLVGARVDPTAPMQVGAIARELGLGLSTASRLCASLQELGLLERADDYGAYRLGRAAIRLSGVAAAPIARAARLELTRAALHSGETVCLAAPDGEGARMIAVIESGWTLHAPAEVAEQVVERDSAIVAAATGALGDLSVAGGCVESRIGRVVEIAAPVLDPNGDRIAVLAIRLPLYRAERGAPRARRAIRVARRNLERAIVAARAATTTADVRAAAAAATSALDASLRILTHLAGGADTLASTARAAGLRLDRARRLVDTCRGVGLVLGDDRLGLRLSWQVHGWYRAALNPTLAGAGALAVSQAAVSTDTCVFLTVLQGLRSRTLVEHLEPLGEGLRMRPWLGRVHPIVGSDGGPTMLLDLEAEQLAEIFPARFSDHERGVFLAQVERVAREGVLTIESVDELGITSISAPVIDASGTVAAAACIVGATERVRPRRSELEAAVRELAAQLSALLG